MRIAKGEVKTDGELSISKRRQLQGQAKIMAAGRTSWEVQYLAEQLQTIAVHKRKG